MQLDKDDYMLGLWFGKKQGLGDVTIMVKRLTDKNNWIGESRYRFTNAAQQRTAEFIATGTEDEVKREIDKVFHKICRDHFTDFSKYVDVRGDTHAAAFKFAMEDWINIESVGLDGLDVQ